MGVYVLVFGTISGLIIALGCMGLAVVFSQYRFLNFAYGEFLTLGAYLYFALGGDGWLSAIAAAVIAACLSVLTHLIVFKPLIGKGPITMTVASMGLGFAAQATFGVIWGTQVKSVRIPLMPFTIGPFGELAVTIAFTTVVLCILVAMLLYGTGIGRQLRASSDNRTLAAVAGVNIRLVGILTWALGGALAAIAGILLAVYSQLTPTMGFMSLFPIIAAVLLSRTGNPFRAAMGGFFIGLASEVAASVIGSAYKPAMAIVALAIGLLVLSWTGRTARV